LRAFFGKVAGDNPGERKELKKSPPLTEDGRKGGEKRKMGLDVPIFNFSPGVGGKKKVYKRRPCRGPTPGGKRKGGRVRCIAPVSFYFHFNNAVEEKKEGNKICIFLVTRGEKKKEKAHRIFHTPRSRRKPLAGTRKERKKGGEEVGASQTLLNQLSPCFTGLKERRGGGGVWEERC